MSVEAYIENKRAIQAALLNYIDGENDDFQHLIQILREQNVREDANDLKDFLILLNIISCNHHRFANFFSKFENLLHFLGDDIRNKFSNSEIYQIFKNNKRILLYLLQENIITLDREIFLGLYKYQLLNKNCYFCEYFAPEIRTFIDRQENINELNFDETLIQKVSITVPNDFYEKRKNGENDCYLCNLIRNDLIDDFIVYVNRNNLPVNSTIAQSIYETNKFLFKNDPSLIEYSAFYGSIQIFQYLRINNANLSSKLWLYSIHGRNAELIHLLEYNHIEPPNKSFKKCLNESIQCHHNNFANYIKETLLQRHNEVEEENDDDDNYNDYDIFHELNELSCIFKYHNYELFPNDLTNSTSIIYNLIAYNYSKLFDIYSNSQNLLVPLFNLDDYIGLPNNEYSSIFGSCSVIRHRITNQVFTFAISTRKIGEDYLNEFDVLSKTQYPSLLKARGFNIIEDETKNAAFLFDYFQNGSLDKYIKKKVKGEIPSELNTNDYILILGISLGLKYLHDHDIVHVSLLPRSILIDDNFYPIISNYQHSITSLSYYLFMGFDYSMDRIYYGPPEVIVGNKYTKYSNIYSLSFMIYQILTRKMLFATLRRRSIIALQNDIHNGIRPDISLIQNNDVAAFLQRCWNNNPKERLTIDEVIDFITSQQFCSYFNLLDHELIKRYLDIYGEEFNNLKDKF